jgi:tetratricopeptide (TPR) repeat protein
MTAIQPVLGPAVPNASRIPPVPWRDPASVSPERLADFIAMLEKACELDPINADLRTCLGMAHAMNYDVYRSMDALEEARRLEPDNFFAQMKYSELLYRLRVLDAAEEETLIALDLASNSWHVSLARKQLSEIRRLRREGSHKPQWSKPLLWPVVVLILTFVCLSFLAVHS